jgi:hypothetical protein
MQAATEAMLCDVCRAPMKLACTLPTLDRFPALRIYERTACRFARPLNLESNVFNLQSRRRPA